MSHLRETVRNHKLAAGALAAVAALALAGVAYALVQKTLDVDGTITGEDVVVEASFVQVYDPNPSDKCTFTVTADKLTITASKVSATVATDCSVRPKIRSTSNIPLRVQGIEVTSDVADVRARLDTGSCGATVQPDGSGSFGTEVAIEVEFSDVAIGASGTVTGTITLVDEASFSTANCPESF